MFKTLDSYLLQPLYFPWDMICFLILVVMDDRVGPSDILVSLFDVSKYEKFCLILSRVGGAFRTGEQIF